MSAAPDITDAMTPDITRQPQSNLPPPKPRRRVKPIALRLPVGLAEKIEERSNLSGQSQNQLLIQAVQTYLGIEIPPAVRLGEMEQAVERLTGLLSTAAERYEDLEERIKRLEEMARRAGADI
jgi:hypothetical protein